MENILFRSFHAFTPLLIKKIFSPISITEFISCELIIVVSNSTVISWISWSMIRKFRIESWVRLITKQILGLQGNGTGNGTFLHTATGFLEGGNLNDFFQIHMLQTITGNYLPFRRGWYLQTFRGDTFTFSSTDNESNKADPEKAFPTSPQQTDIGHAHIRQISSVVFNLSFVDPVKPNNAFHKHCFTWSTGAYNHIRFYRFRKLQIRF